MHSPSRVGPRLARGATACQRCRRRKQKCDLKQPSCSNCESSDALCLVYHPGKQAEIPRNYVSNLEKQVDRLTRQVEELQRANQEKERAMTSPTASDASPSQFQDLVQSVRNVVVEPSRQPRFLGQSSGLTLARLVMAAIRTDALPSPLFAGPRVSDSSFLVPAPEASLPPRHAANHLLQVYFQYRTPHLPIVEPWEVEQALENAYRGHSSTAERGLEQDLFTAYMVLAIALFDVPHVSGGRPTQSEGCFQSAMGCIEKVLTYSPSDLDTLRAILLLAQFVALYPARGSLWHLTGTALRLCIDMGLHWETEEQSLHMDPVMLHQRRRLWYSTYQFDRLLCITLGRPVGIIDESTSVPLPDPGAAPPGAPGGQGSAWDMHRQRAHNHLVNMSKLESEIKHVQHSQAWARRIAYPRANYAAWVQDILPRLHEWHATVPPLGDAHAMSIFACQAYWDAIYHNAVLLLYRPNATIPHVSTDELAVSFEASTQLIASIKVLQREGKVDIRWKTVHQLFMAGLGVIYALWLSKTLRDRPPVSRNITVLQACGSTLSALSESFPGAVGCRDAFDTLSMATVDMLVAGDHAGDKQDHHASHLEFGKQVEDVLQQLQTSAGSTELSAMLSADALSEMLSSAAQWPDFQDFVFDDRGFNGEVWFQ
ncbi:hypothetical protein ASPZODRAFT_1313064 [Penicilliopsis zonata CBS 506.65]|uniref:Zn(2)-C6 fungal-type domain-containing protein n=1 Tax=Penicilliopsis zonata CBS 506.65 TaxID=1073090 RepID=A0A1L9S5R6_9EURO|nr:hypothetical protein ASPZODRAFT_1313064 [Penicilliopsis zonata CBS 506.65]OJJ42498.1 hypothetical protein ASPZODRAFT_1313064 [Penicilliopsis zonata CBS 506.65]